MNATTVLVGMAEIHLLKGSGTFSCLGLGSCIGICALDPASNVAACAHVMLPASFPDRPVDKIGKFANTAVPEMIAMMERMGASRRNIVVAIAGGAQVFKFGNGAAGKLDIGNRNTVAVEQHLGEMGIQILAKECGGNNGRTVYFIVESGKVSIKSAANGEKPLCTLRK